MNDRIKSNIGNYEALENLYRSDRKAFKTAFEKVYPEIENSEAARFWKTRLEYDDRTEALKNISVTEILKVIAICFITAFLIKIPEIFHISSSGENFLLRNTSIIVFSGLFLYSAFIRRNTQPVRMLITAIVLPAITIYINFLPSGEKSSAIQLAYIHLPLLMWFLFGIVYSDFNFRSHEKRIDFIRFNGDLAIVYALIAIAGGMLSAFTIGLFDSVGLNIEEFYSRNIILTGAVSAPVVAVYIIEKFPALVSRVASLIASIFSPMVLVTLIIFLITVAVTGKDPYNNRSFLLVFNLMLLGVMGIITFSISESSAIRYQRFNSIILMSLSIAAIITDLVALSAIFYRLGEYGVTPNRLAVLVSNLLVLANLILISVGLFKINFKAKDFKIVEIAVSEFLPVYLIWIIIVVFGFPLIFGVK